MVSANAFFASQTFDDAEVITQHRKIREKGQVTKLILLSQPYLYCVARRHMIFPSEGFEVRINEILMI